MQPAFIPVIIFGFIGVIIFLLFEIFYRDRFVREGYYRQFIQKKKKIQGWEFSKKLFIFLSAFSIILAVALGGYIIALSEKTAETGRFQQANEAQRKHKSPEKNSDNTEIEPQIEQLRLYKAGQPFREDYPLSPYHTDTEATTVIQDEKKPAATEVLVKTRLAGDEKSSQKTAFGTIFIAPLTKTAKLDPDFTNSAKLGRSATYRIKIEALSKIRIGALRVVTSMPEKVNWKAGTVNLR